MKKAGDAGREELGNLYRKMAELNMLGITSTQQRSRNYCLLFAYALIIAAAVSAALGLFTGPARLLWGMPASILFLTGCAVCLCGLAVVGYHFVFSKWAKTVDDLQSLSSGCGGNQSSENEETPC